MAAGFGGAIGYKIILEQREISLQDELDRSKALIDKEAKIDNEITLVNQHIEIAKKVDTLKSKDTDTLLKDVNKLMPSDIVIANCNYSSRTSIVMNGTAKSQPTVEEFYANLREDEQFKNCHISTINNSDGSVSFNVEILLSVEKEVSENVEAE